MDVIRDVAAPMRDGTMLRADVHRPPGPGPFPVLLRRTPYGKQAFAGLASELAARGYLVVVQDIRGRHASDGAWVWAFAETAQRVEAEDGFDTVEWAARLPDADGRVGAFGHSYDAWASWRLAAERPPSLRGILTAGITARLLDVTHGIFDLGRRLEWCYLEAAEARRRAGGRGGPTSYAEAERDWAEVERGKWLWFTPLDDIPSHVFSLVTPQLKRFLREVDRELWALDEIHPLVEVPVCVVTGWWDRFVHGVDHFTGMRRNGPAATRDAHRLIVGPWSHDPDGYGEPFPALDPGPAGKLSFAQIVDDFFAPLLRGRPRDDGPPVRVFELGGNRWRAEPDWPPRGASPTPLYLRGGGRANTAFGDGRLSRDLPGDEPSDRYTYDPRDPVMSLMGADSQLAPTDQAPNDGRADKLVYRTEPLEAGLRVAGPVSAVLWAASSAPQTDWVARLIREDAAGRAVNLAEGVLRAAMEPGVPRELHIRLTPACVAFLPGERIRLDVTSSDFPNHDRNHNTGADFWSDRELRPARQEIFHAAARPSRLVLPIRPGGDLDG
ncbi:CocE/NonD family hydrolase [Nonomuraea sediminis]|uniref:CocE/NonD family hydrolase n=1 Tax=Nonomuraea sediminis TaxID=2835864 RepID=UPI001BDBC66C|nr:CocE/NonD family hydrolase [Nonomuraea sediminis]